MLVHLYWGSLKTCSRLWEAVLRQLIGNLGASQSSSSCTPHGFLQHLSGLGPDFQAGQPWCLPCSARAPPLLPGRPPNPRHQLHFRPPLPRLCLSSVFPSQVNCRLSHNAHAALASFISPTSSLFTLPDPRLPSWPAFKGVVCPGFFHSLTAHCLPLPTAFPPSHPDSLSTLIQWTLLPLLDFLYIEAPFLEHLSSMNSQASMLLDFLLPLGLATLWFYSSHCYPPTPLPTTHTLPSLFKKHFRAFHM